MAEVLNLVNPNDKLSFKYEISRFPDGQQSLRLIEEGYNTFQSLRDSDKAHGIRIYSRLNTFRDLEIVICATQALKEVGVDNISLYIPYCIGARSDRKFMDGGINYVKNVIAPIINSQGYRKVTILDPHSDVLEACINNFEKKSNTDLVQFALEDLTINLWRKTTEDWSHHFWLKHVWSKNQDIVLVSPDAGAFKKIFDVAKHFGIDKVVTASKVRNLKTGEILKTEISNLPISTTENEFRYVIVDDICDGGRTFIELAKAIKEQRPDALIYLIVTHGIFSANFDYLTEHIEGIYCTNSFKDIEPGVDCPIFGDESYVKQLNVF